MASTGAGTYRIAQSAPADQIGGVFRLWKCLGSRANGPQAECHRRLGRWHQHNHTVVRSIRTPGHRLARFPFCAACGTDWRASAATVWGVTVSIILPVHGQRSDQAAHRALIRTA